MLKFQTTLDTSIYLANTKTLFNIGNKLGTSINSIISIRIQ